MLLIIYAETLEVFTAVRVVTTHKTTRYHDTTTIICYTRNYQQVEQFQLRNYRERT
jgi:hypothetical protein